MEQLIDLVLAQINTQKLAKLTSQLRILDNELDIKMEEIHAAQQDVSVLDRINIFAVSESEQALREENIHYREIRHQHAQIVEQIKDLVRVAIYRDSSVALKVQSGAIINAVSVLRVEHRWGVNAKVHQYQIQGIGPLKDRVDHLAEMINSQYDFDPDPIDSEDLLGLVYDEILRRGGFIE